MRAARFAILDKDDAHSWGLQGSEDPWRKGEGGGGRAREIHDCELGDIMCLFWIRYVRLFGV